MSDTRRVPKYRIYIDESGDHTYDNLENAKNRYLCLAGCIIECEYYRTCFHPEFEEFKQKHFPHDPDEPIILVRQQIVGKKGPFWVLRDPKKRDAFNQDLLQFIKDHDISIIAVVIDKKQNLECYGSAAYHPYHYSIAAMMERYAGLMNFRGKCGDSMAESRVGQDKYLKQAYRQLMLHGTFFRGPSFFQTGLTSLEIKLRDKLANISGLQLADLLAHPCKEEILIELGLIKDTRGAFTKEFRTELEPKFNRQIYNGQIWGYGKVFLPQRRPLVKK